MKPGTSKILLAAVLGGMAGTALAHDNGDRERRSCAIPAATVTTIQAQLARVATMDNGGLFNPGRLWSAVVDRQGVLCSAVRLGDASRS